ncbi:hypothetical protein FXO38_03478 [Capsicum annuum]|nr:hypothetical protein FXO38_03478 [Capsicum annuum]
MRSYTANNRGNHHPTTIDMTKAVISINSSSTNPTLLKPLNFNQGYSSPNPISNGVFTKQQHLPEGTLSLYTAPPPPNQSPTSWAELFLEEKTISHSVIIGD